MPSPRGPCCAGKAEPAVHGDGGAGGSGKPDLAHTLAGQCCPQSLQEPFAGPGTPGLVKEALQVVSGAAVSVA